MSETKHECDVATEARRDGYSRDEQGRMVITADGVSYTLEPMDIQVDIAAVEEHLVNLESKRPNLPAHMAAQIEALKAFPRLQAELTDRFYRELKAGRNRKPGRAEIFEWLDTREGLIWTIKRQMNKRYPEITEKQVIDILNKAGFGEESQLASLRDSSNPKMVAIADAVQKAGVSVDDLLKQAE